MLLLHETEQRGQTRGFTAQFADRRQMIHIDNAISTTSTSTATTTSRTTVRTTADTNCGNLLKIIQHITASGVVLLKYQ